MNLFKLNRDWTLFLDRDGVINKKIDNDYVKKWSEFIFIENSLKAISVLSNYFKRIFLVTNQRGVGKGLMSLNDLNNIHKIMNKKIQENGGRIDKIYFCTSTNDKSLCRKPNIGMANSAKSDYPDIDFKKSLIVGDSTSDILFGKKAGMMTILISKKNKHIDFTQNPDGIFESLYDFSLCLKK